MTARARKARRKLPQGVEEIFQVLLAELEIAGPVRGNWPNYGKLGRGCHHCHLKKGKPTYVTVWEEVAGHVRLMEVTYVGTHEKASY